jgi:Na+/proline symporter
MGLIVGTLALTNNQFNIPADQPDLMIPVFIRDFLPHGIIGILIVAILSAAMSSLSSAINSLSAVTTEDFILRGKTPGNTQYVRVSKGVALAWGIICMLLSFFAGDIAPTVIEAINKIGSVFFGPILATFLIALRIRRVGAFPMNAGLLTGVGVNIFMWLVVGDQVFWFWWNALGFLVTLMVSIVLSFIRSTEITPGVDEQQETLYTRENLVLLIYFFLIVIMSLSLAKML